MATERRKEIISNLQQAVEQLTSPQGFALGEYTQSGGELAFTRRNGEGAIAVVKFDGSLITIDKDGTVTLNPDITVRAE